MPFTPNEATQKLLSNAPSFRFQHEALAVFIQHTYPITAGQETFVLAGSEDLRALLPYLLLLEAGDDVCILIRPYIHSMVLYLQKTAENEFKAFLFDSQSWGVCYYPTRLIMDALQDFYGNKIEIILSGREIQAKHEQIGCVENSLAFLAYCREKKSCLEVGTFDLFAELNDKCAIEGYDSNCFQAQNGALENFYRSIKSPQFVAETSEKNLSALEKIIQDFYLKDGLVGEEKFLDTDKVDACIKKMQGFGLKNQLPLYSENGYNLELNLGQLSVDFSFKNKDFIYNNCLIYSEERYPGQVTLEKSKTIFDGIEGLTVFIDETNFKITLQASRQEILERLPAILIEKSPTFFTEQMRQSLGLSMIADQLGNEIALAKIMQNNQNGGFDESQVILALHYIFRDSEEAYVPSVEELSELISCVDHAISKKHNSLVFPMKNGPDHIVGVKLNIEDKENIQATIYDSYPGFTEEVNTQLEELFPGVKIEAGEVCAQQTDEWSCGVHAIANLTAPFFSDNKQRLDLPALAREYYFAYKKQEKVDAAIEASKTNALLLIDEKSDYFSAKTEAIFNHVGRLSSENREKIALYFHHSSVFIKALEGNLFLVDSAAKTYLVSEVSGFENKDIFIEILEKIIFEEKKPLDSLFDFLGIEKEGFSKLIQNEEKKCSEQDLDFFILNLFLDEMVSFAKRPSGHGSLSLIIKQQDKDKNNLDEQKTKDLNVFLMGAFSVLEEDLHLFQEIRSSFNKKIHLFYEIKKHAEVFNVFFQDVSVNKKVEYLNNFLSKNAIGWPGVLASFPKDKIYSVAVQYASKIEFFEDFSQVLRVLVGVVVPGDKLLDFTKKHSEKIESGLRLGRILVVLKEAGVSKDELLDFTKEHAGKIKSAWELRDILTFLKEAGLSKDELLDFTKEHSEKIQSGSELACILDALRKANISKDELLDFTKEHAGKIESSSDFEGVLDVLRKTNISKDELLDFTKEHSEKIQSGSELACILDALRKANISKDELLDFTKEHAGKIESSSEFEGVLDVLRKAGFSKDELLGFTTNHAKTIKMNLYHWDILDILRKEGCCRNGLLKFATEHAGKIESSWDLQNFLNVLKEAKFSKEELLDFVKEHFEKIHSDWWNVLHVLTKVEFSKEELLNFAREHAKRIQLTSEAENISNILEGYGVSSSELQTFAASLNVVAGRLLTPLNKEVENENSALGAVGIFATSSSSWQTQGEVRDPSQSFGRSGSPAS